MNLNIDAVKNQTFDAIVVGSGISGGWAAKELTEKGLRVAVLERGREIKHIEGYETAMKDPWDFAHRGRPTNMAAEEYWAGMRTGYTANEEHRYLFENDKQNPYIEKKGGFDWIRAYHTGGKSLLWGRQSYRWNKADFEANLKEGVGVDWPIRYEDLAPWYTYVEKFAGISGQAEGLDVLPDSHFLPAMQMTAPETHFTNAVKSKLGRPVTVGRVAHLTKPGPQHTAVGRGSCQYRNKCMRGCPYGGYFSSLSATLPAAARTKRLVMVHNAIVSEVIFDDKTQKAKGVRVIDQNTMAVTEYYAKIIFLNAGAIPSASILMNSKSNRFPTGMGNESDQLGRNIMDHHLGVGASASVEGFNEDYFFGNRPNGLYIPRFRNWGKDKRDYLRGFGYQGGASRAGWGRGVGMDGFGASFKEDLTHPGSWSIGFGGFGEILPNESNRFTLSDQKDKWGLPVLSFESEFGQNELKMREDMMNDAAEMLEAAGFKNISTYNSQSTHIGLGIHEMGTARMGRDPKTSVLNKHNQVHAVKNVFVTDGAAMVSASCVNPSLTYMALTARAADFAVSELKKKNL
ncbi:MULTISPECIES: GMC oxidoreductase [Flectobacillus]|uniref:GMC family oxidoreductase n=2 Tax=Flectobacillus TaxID=101 RepID=A0ABT6Z3S4_9BACT|nr:MULTISPECIES: GMC family oxidoreductase [Flectobacillus]MDI9864700.1 GMC family oxidoreductase [Flectobacillus longus]MDI9875781.1 GMC family oxidoreductase [Flectobacillus rivi]